MEGPRVGGVQLVDWCICGPTRKALKTRSRSELNFLLFCFFNKKILVLLSALVERFGVSCMWDFLNHIFAYYNLPLPIGSDEIIKRLQMWLNNPQC